MSSASKLLKEQIKDLAGVADLFQPVVAKYKLLEKFEVHVVPVELARLIFVCVCVCVCVFVCVCVCVCNVLHTYV